MPVHPNTLKNLKRGNTVNVGRKPVVKEAKAFMKEVLESAEYRASARERILSGRAPHLEKLWHEYVEGKPTERVELSGPDGQPVRILEVIRPTESKS